MTEVAEEIIEGCKKQDAECQKIVYELFYKQMYSVCLRYAYNQDEARDLLHDGFIKVFKYIKSYHGESGFYPWIKKVITNQCIDHVRSAYKKHIKYEDHFELNNNLENDSDHEETFLEANDIQPRQLVTAMNKLRPDYKTILNLYAIEKLSHEEIAEKLGIKAVSSRSKLSRARSQLKKILGLTGERV